MNAFTLYIPPKGHTLILRDTLDINKLSPDKCIISTTNPKCFPSSCFYGQKNAASNYNWILSGELYNKLLAMPNKGKDWKERNEIADKLKDHDECMVPVIIPAGTEMGVTYYSIRGNHYEQSFIRFRVSSLKITVDIPIKKLNSVYFEEYTEEAQGKTTKNKSSIVI